MCIRKHHLDKEPSSSMLWPGASSQPQGTLPQNHVHGVSTSELRSPNRLTCQGRPCQQHRRRRAAAARALVSTSDAVVEQHNFALDQLYSDILQEKRRRLEHNFDASPAFDAVSPLLLFSDPCRRVRASNILGLVAPSCTTSGASASCTDLRCMSPCRTILDLHGSGRISRDSGRLSLRALPVSSRCSVPVPVRVDASSTFADRAVVAPGALCCSRP